MSLSEFLRNNEPAGHTRYGSQTNPIWSPGDGTDRSGTTVQGASGNWITGGSPGGIDDFLSPKPPSPPGPGPSGGGSSWGGGAAAPDWGTLTKLFTRLPQGFKYQPLDLPEYQGTGFYKFNNAPYEQRRKSADTAFTDDLAAGNTAYSEAAGELARYQNPFSGRDFQTNPQQSAAMQRMLAANRVAPDQATINQGANADQAFGNVLALLGGVADQSQAATMRALGGDQRRFGESLASEQRGINNQIEMRRAQALDQYQKDKWMYGEDIARQNYQTRIAMETANNQGLNQTTMANVQAFNDYVSGNANMLAELAASGQTVPTSVTSAVTGLGPALEAAMKAAAASGGA